MTKLLAAIAATFLTVTAIASVAEAGGCHGGGGYFRAARHFQSHRRVKHKVEVAHREVSKTKVAVAKPTVVAKAEPAAAEPADTLVQTVAENESSSIATAENVAKIDAGQKPVQQVATANKEVGCKSFFPSVGMTLSVPCAK